MEWIEARLETPEDSYKVFIRTISNMNIGYYDSDEKKWYYSQSGKFIRFTDDEVISSSLRWLDETQKPTDVFND